MKYLYNNTGSEQVYIAKSISASSYYQIPANLEIPFSMESSLMVAIAAGDTIVSKTDDSTGHIPNVNEAIDYLKGNIAKEVLSTTPPFTNKTTIDGKNLYARTTGKSFTLTAGANTLDFDIPYAHVKITGMEIIGSEVGDTLDFFVLDDDSGTYSTVPNYVLNQFGYDVAVPDGFYKRESNYDADLYYNMCISITYYSTSAKTVYINYVLHEVKD